MTPALRVSPISCLQRIHGFDATFDSNGLLTVSRCPKGARQQFTPFPDTRLWSVKQKTHEKAAYQTNVMRQLKVGGGGMEGWWAGPWPCSAVTCLCAVWCSIVCVCGWLHPENSVAVAIRQAS